MEMEFLFLREAIRSLIISSVCYLLFGRIIHVKVDLAKKMLIGFGFIIISTSIFLLLRNYIYEPYRTAIVIITMSAFIAFSLKEKIEKMIFLFFILYAVSFVLHMFAITLTFIILYPFGIPKEKIIHGITQWILSICLTVLIMKTKLDYNLIFKKFSSGIFLSISFIIIILFGLFKEDFSNKETILAILGFLALGYGIYSWFHRETVILRNENTKDSILAQKEADYKILHEMHDSLASELHKDYKKLDAMQRAVEKLISCSTEPVVLEDAKKILDEINISKLIAEEEYQKKIYHGITLPQTGMTLVDAKYEMMFESAVYQNIDFLLEVHGDVSALDQFVSQLDLTNLIGDFAENAYIAIRHLDNIKDCHKVHFTIGETIEGYELSFSDSGIPFEIGVLEKLGIERITSHADDGGSGYGYETIFALMKRYDASLEITEYEQSIDAFTKKITIRFDGKSDFIIHSFRADKIRNEKMIK